MTIVGEVFLQEAKESNPCTGLDRPWGFQEPGVPRFHDNRHMKVVRLLPLRTGRLYPPPRKYSRYSFLLVAGSISDGVNGIFH